MLLAVQIPIADARPLLDTQTHKLDRPRFDLGFDPDQVEFLRSFGPLEERRPGLPVDWPAEDVYCQAARGLRIQTAALASLKPSANAPGSFVPAFRRFLSNGKAVARIELGFVRQPVHLRAGRLAREDVPPLLMRLADLEVLCRAQEQYITTTVAAAGQVLAAQLMSSTTQWSKAAPDFRSYGWWVTPGRPLLYLEYRKSEIAGLPREVTWVGAPASGMSLAYASLEHRGSRILVWLLGVKPGYDHTIRRALRLHLFRLHSEREVLRLVLRHIADGRFELPARVSKGHPLKIYLENALGFLTREHVYGAKQSPLLDAAYGFEDLMTGAQRRSLLERLHGTFRTLEERLDAFTEPKSDEGGTYPILRSS